MNAIATERGLKNGLKRWRPKERHNLRDGVRPLMEYQLDFSAQVVMRK